MSSIYDVANVITVVTGTGQCVYDEILVSGGGSLNRVCLLVPGEVAWDECECGQLAQSITQVYPSSTFPVLSSNVSHTKCGPPLVVVEVSLSVVRCVPIPDQNGKSPKCSHLQTSAITLEADRFATKKALLCCLSDSYQQNNIINFTIGSAISVGPQGACSGFTITYSVGFTNACCG